MPAKIEPLRRSLRFERSAMDVGNRSLNLSVSSDTDKGERWVSGFGWVREILSHAPGAVDLSRFTGEDGGPLLYNHDFSQLIGRFHSTSLEGGKWRGTARFGSGPDAELRWQEVQDRVLVDVSITYDYAPEDVEPLERDGNGKVTAVRVNKWQPYEVSMVTVPFDASVGAGRMAGSPSGAAGVHPNPPAAPAGSPEVRMPPEGTHPTPPAATSDAPNLDEVRAQAAKDAGARAAQILEIGAHFNIQPEKIREWIGQGASVEQVNAEILKGFRDHAKPLPMTQAIGMTERDKQRYSIARAALALADKSRSSASFELEISQEVEKKLGRSSAGFLIPSDMPFRGSRGANAQSTDTTYAGGELVFKEYAGFIDLLKNDSVMLRMGSRLISGLVGTPTWVKQTGTTQIYWVGENPDADVADSKMTFAVVNATPKTAKAMASYTRQQLLQGVEAIDQMLQRDLVENHSLALDLAALQGTGSTYQPTGLLNTTDIIPFPLGTNGDTPTYDTVVDMETLLAEYNAIQIGTPRYLTTPGIKGLLKKTAELGNTANVPVWRGGELNGYPAEASNQVPSTLTKGASSGTCHALIHGIVSELFLLEWGALEMTVDPYTLMGQDLVRLSTSHILDVFVRRPSAFVVCKDALKS